MIELDRRFFDNPTYRNGSAAVLTSTPMIWSTDHGGSAKGHTDYTTLTQDRAEEPKACVDD